MNVRESEPLDPEPGPPLKPCWLSSVCPHRGPARTFLPPLGRCNRCGSCRYRQMDRWMRAGCTCWKQG